MSWDTQRDSFQAEFDQLNSTNNVSGMIADLQTALNKYLSTKTDADYNTVTSLAAQIQTLSANYTSLNDKIVQAIKSEVQNNDLSTMLFMNASLQSKIIKLEKRRKELQEEVDTAVARDEVLRSRETNGNTHQLFLLDRPIRKAMIPYLWALAVLFIGIGIVLYKTLLPPLPSFGGVNGFGNSASMEGLLSELLLNKTVLITLLVCIAAIVITAALNVGGLFKSS